VPPSAPEAWTEISIRMPTNFSGMQIGAPTEPLPSMLEVELTASRHWKRPPMSSSAEPQDGSLQLSSLPQRSPRLSLTRKAPSWSRATWSSRPSPLTSARSTTVRDRVVPTPPPIGPTATLALFAEARLWRSELNVPRLVSSERPAWAMVVKS
jgi:hypothetical protein